MTGPRVLNRPHGAVRGLNYVSRSPTEDSRFGRMFRWLPGETYDKQELGLLAVSMIQQESAKASFPGTGVAEGPSAEFNTPPPDLDKPFGTAEAGDENPTIPAGYTYFGQFIDHDLTFDPNSSLQKLNDPEATQNFRTPEDFYSIMRVATGAVVKLISYFPVRNHLHAPVALSPCLDQTNFN